ncbi:MCE family protein [Nocardia sp. NPDC055321]
MRGIGTPIKLAVFATVMAMIFAGLVVVFGQIRFAPASDFRALFTSSSGMLPGAKVRIAGVPVGTVTSVELGPDYLAHVGFRVDSEHVLRTSTRAAIRYENLVGDRYLELLDGPGEARELAAGATIDVEHTAPALDLDMLLGGFKPLLRGLDPDRANNLTDALIRIFQGQGGNLVSLLNDGGSFAQTLGDRDALIGSVIDNLNTVLATIDERGDQFTSTITEIRRLVSGLAADRDAIGEAIPRIAGATGDLTDLLAQSRPDLRATVEQTSRVAGLMNEGSDTIQWVLDRLPQTYRDLIRIGSYGSFLNMYMCSVVFLVDGPNGTTNEIAIPGQQTTGRCAHE